jgi:hypothetical protein
VRLDSLLGARECCPEHCPHAEVVRACCLTLNAKSSTAQTRSTHFLALEVEQHIRDGEQRVGWYRHTSRELQEILPEAAGEEGQEAKLVHPPIPLASAEWVLE